MVKKVWVTDSYTWQYNPETWYMKYIMEKIGEEVPIRSDGRYYFVKSEERPPPNILCGIEWTEERMQ